MFISRPFVISSIVFLTLIHSNPTRAEVSKGTWASAAPAPTPRDHLAVATAGNRIYTIGGRPDLDYHRNMGTVEEYDPHTNQWRTMTLMPTARHGLGSAVVDGRLYVISGGPAPGGSFSQVNEVFTPPVAE